MDGSLVNIDVTAPGAIIALTLMYLKVTFSFKNSVKFPSTRIIFTTPSVIENFSTLFICHPILILPFLRRENIVPTTLNYQGKILQGP